MSLWDILPVEIQDIIVEKSFKLCREEYLEQNGKKHEKTEKGTFNCGCVKVYHV
jgi:hypothetical protein